MSSLKCEDEDLGGPNCPTYTGTLAVYRFTLAIVLFFLFMMLITIGISSSKSFRAHIHNGFWLWKIIFGLILVLFCFKMPFFGLMKTGKQIQNILFYQSFILFYECIFKFREAFTGLDSLKYLNFFKSASFSFK